MTAAHPALTWRGMTIRSRDAVRLAYTRALHHALAAGADSVALPPLPEGTHPLTVRALHRRGLVEGDRLTPLAIETVRWCNRWRARPVRTVRPARGLL